MKRIHAAILVLTAAAALVGLNVLLARVLDAPDGWSLSSDLELVALGVATALALVLAGVLLGVLHGRSARGDRRDRELRGSALEYERTRNAALSEENYESRKRIVALEERIRELTRAAPAPSRQAAEPDGAGGGATGEDEPADARAAALEEQAALRGEIAALQERYERLRRELGSRRERMTDLMAELSVAQTEADEARAEAADLRSRMPDAVAPLERLEGKSIREVLEGIVGIEGVNVALVADDAGLVVDSAGDVLQPDALAALSGIAADISPRVKDLLPIGEITTVALGDSAGKVLEVRYFPLFGAACALAIIREEIQVDPRIARAAVEAIVSRLQD